MKPFKILMFVLLVLVTVNMALGESGEGFYHFNCSDEGSATVIFADPFDRADSGTVGNSWTETEGGTTTSEIADEQLKITDTDGSNAITVEHAFTGQGGKFNVSYVARRDDDSWSTSDQIYDGVTQGIFASMMQNDGTYLKKWGNYDTGWTVYGNAWTTGQNHTVRWEVDIVSDTFDFYVDGASIATGLSFRNTMTNADSIKYTTGNSHQFNSWYIDDVCVYTGALPAFATGGSAGVASERLEQTSTLEQTGSATINSNNYVSILSGEIEITPSSPVYAVASVPITTATATNTAQCRITADGTDYDSVQSRTNTAGASGHLSLMSNTTIVPAGNYTVNLECRRSSGTGSYTVSGANLIAHQLTTSGGVQLEYNYSENTQAASTSVPLISQKLTTSENATDTGYKRYLVAEWIGAPTYSTNANVTYNLEVAGTNCTSVKRYGTGGSTGSAGGICVQPAPTNSTQYDIRLWAWAGGASVSTNAKLTVKEIISHTLEVRNTSLAAESVTSTALAHIANLTITPNALHDPANIVVRAGVSAQSDNNNSVDMSFLLVGGDNSTTISRTVNKGQPGVVVLDHIIENVTAATTISLYASCSLNNCTINGGDLTAYLSDAEPISPNVFYINATDYYTGQPITSFNVNITGATLSTTTGSIAVSTTDTYINISTPGVKATDGTIAYFSNNTENHNTSTNLSLVLRPYTAIYAKSGAGNPISNYSINYTDTNTSTTYGAFTTTSGAIYIPLFNSTYNVTIFDSPGSAKRTAEFSLNASYLRNYTFTLLQENSFNLSIYDEITNTLITGENFTIELISDVFANNYTTTNGTLEVTLLTPSSYTIRYRSPTYTERDYIVTLSPQTYNTISLYAITINESSQLLAYVEDTGGDPVETAQISLLRYFVDSNSYKIVEMAETSYAGEAGFWVQATEGFYKWSVNYQGQNEFLSTSPENIYTDTRIFILDLTPSYYASYAILPDLASSIQVNYATNALTFTWSDPNGLTNRGCIFAEKLAGVQWTSAGNNCALGSSGSVVLTPGNFSEQRFKYWATIDTNTTYSSHILHNGYTDIAQDLWKSLSGIGTPATNLGQFLAIGVITGMALLFSFSATAVLVVTAVALVFTNFLGLLPFSLQFITGMVALALGFGLYLMRR